MHQVRRRGKYALLNKESTGHLGHCESFYYACSLENQKERVERMKQ